MSVGLRYR